jgi:glutamate transport system permease protein
MSSVLYDAPGPRARTRNRVIGVITIVVVVAIIALILYRFWETNQFSPTKWRVFTFPLVQRSILEATGATLYAFVLAAIGSVVLGLLLALGRLSTHAWLRVPVSLITELLRAVPVLIMMMILYYGLPPLGMKFITPLIAVVAGLVLYNGSVLAEVFRAGVQSLPKGQNEAAQAIGLRRMQIMWLVLLPQATRAMLPVILSQLVVVLKDTALGFIVTYHELLYYAKFIGSSFNYGSPIIPATIVMGSIYIILCLILSGIAKLVERRLRRGGKTSVRAAAPALAANVTNLGSS